MSSSYNSSPPKHLHGMQWDSFSFLKIRQFILFLVFDSVLLFNSVDMTEASVCSRKLGCVWLQSPPPPLCIKLRKIKKKYEITKKLKN
jgi:hypothetical protein